MTRTAARLAELDRISRERSLTDDEAGEVKRLAHLQRQCARRRQRYATDPAFRRMMIERAVSWRRDAARAHSCRDQRVVAPAMAEA